MVLSLDSYGFVILLVFCCVNLGFIYHLNDRCSDTNNAITNSVELFFQIKSDITALKVAQKDAVNIRELNAFKSDVSERILQANDGITRINEYMQNINSKINEIEIQYNQLSSSINDLYTSYHALQQQQQTELNKYRRHKYETQLNSDQSEKGNFKKGENNGDRSDGDSFNDGEINETTDTMDDSGDIYDNMKDTIYTEAHDHVDAHADTHAHAEAYVADDDRDEYRMDLINPNFEYVDVRRKVIMGLKEDILLEKSLGRYAKDVGEYFKKDLKIKLNKFDENTSISDEDLENFGHSVESVIKETDAEMLHKFEFVSDDKRTFHGAINIKLQKNVDGKGDNEIIVNTKYYFDLFYVKK